MASILYIAQFFSTEAEPGGQGQRHYKHANALVEDGHHVTVITSGSTTMNIQPTGDASAQQPWIHPNLRILKVPCAPMAKRSVLSRAINYFAFSFKALMLGLKLLYSDRQSFQFVLGSSPPLLIGLVAYVLSVLARAEFFLEVRDLWSQTMAANGFIKNPLVIALNRALESFLYQRSHRILVVSRPFAEEIEAQVPGSFKKIQFVPNGADLEFFEYPRLWRGTYLNQGPAEHDPVYNIVYAGVFSDYTRLEVLLEAAEKIRERAPRIRFNLVGGGYQFDNLKRQAQARSLDNVAFWNALPKNRISKFLMEGDLSIINYRKLDVFGQVLPNKLFDYLAAGRPILAAVPEGEVSRVLAESGAGDAVEPENVDALVAKILWFYENQETALRMGLRGQRYVRRHYNRIQLVERFLTLFPRVIPLDPAKRREAIGVRPANVVSIHRVKMPG